jgi:hypothetical protein
MAFLRFTRDNRGYEQFSLVETGTNRRGKSRTRLLYWYRTPPNVRVGREPFDESVRRALEAQYPAVQFDWRKIVETPIPSAETDRWRERRRADKAEKAARRAPVVPGVLVDDERHADPDAELDVQRDEPANAVEERGELSIDGEAMTATGDTPQPATSEQSSGESRGRRRRRRRSDRGREQTAPQTVAGGTPLAPEPESQSDIESDLHADFGPDIGSDLTPDSMSDSEPEGE